MAQKDFKCDSTLSSLVRENVTGKFVPKPFKNLQMTKSHIDIFQIYSLKTKKVYFDQGSEVLYEKIWQRRLCEIQERF